MLRVDAPGLITSPAAIAALIAALVWAPLTGFPTLASLSRARFGSTILITIAVAAAAFVLARRVPVLFGGG